MGWFYEGLLKPIALMGIRLTACKKKGVKKLTAFLNTEHIKYAFSKFGGQRAFMFHKVVYDAKKNKGLVSRI